MDTVGTLTALTRTPSYSTTHTSTHPPTFDMMSGTCLMGTSPASADTGPQKCGLLEVSLPKGKSTIE